MVLEENSEFLHRIIRVLLMSLDILCVFRVEFSVFKNDYMVLEENLKVLYRIIMILFMKISILNRIIWFKLKTIWNFNSYFIERGLYAAGQWTSPFIHAKLK